MAEKKENKPTVESAQAKIAAGEDISAAENALLKEFELEKATNVLAER